MLNFFALVLHILHSLLSQSESSNFFMYIITTLIIRARAILLVFEKFTRAYLFQIALEIMWLPILILSFNLF